MSSSFETPGPGRNVAFLRKAHDISQTRLAREAGVSLPLLIIESLESDERVRYLSVASEVSKLMQHDWRTCLKVAREPQAAPQPRKLAKGLAKEAVLESDAESRWCGAYLLRELVPVLGR